MDYAQPKAARIRGCRPTAAIREGEKFSATANCRIRVFWYKSGPHRHDRKLVDRQETCRWFRYRGTDEEFDAAAEEILDKERWRFEVDANPEIATSWILLPRDKPHSSFTVARYRNDTPSVVELVKPTHETSLYDGSVIN
jgi:hypothetical protein